MLDFWCKWRVCCSGCHMGGTLCWLGHPGEHYCMQASAFPGGSWSYWSPSCFSWRPWCIRILLILRWRMGRDVSITVLPSDVPSSFWADFSVIHTKCCSTPLKPENGCWYLHNGAARLDYWWRFTGFIARCEPVGQYHLVLQGIDIAASASNNVASYRERASAIRS